MAQDLQVFQTFRNEMDRLFDEFVGFTPLARRVGQPVPIAEMAEDETGYRITTELPGIKQSDVEINLAGNTLLLKAERRAEEEVRGRSYHLRERTYGTLVRQFRLPDDVDRQNIVAEMRDGVLSLVLPKSRETRTERRRIDIKTA